MACQLLRWLLEGAGPATLQLTLLGIGCLLTTDAFSQWSSNRRPEIAASRPVEASEQQQRRAA